MRVGVCRRSAQASDGDVARPRVHRWQQQQAGLGWAEPVPSPPSFILPLASSLCFFSFVSKCVSCYSVQTRS